MAHDPYGGVGIVIAPVFFLAVRRRNMDGRTDFFWAARTKGYIMYVK